MKIYGDIQSGNCYKVKLLCSLLDIQHEWIHIDILIGQTKTSHFLAKNPNGKIPLLELADGQLVSESNAIINFLAAGSDYLPKDAYTLAKVQQWQFFEQYSHEPYIAVARYIAKYLGLPESRKTEYESKQDGGIKALTVMEKQLEQTLYLTGDKATTADITLFAYTHVAQEGGFDVSKFPAIIAWIKRIEGNSKFIPMYNADQLKFSKV